MLNNGFKFQMGMTGRLEVKLNSGILGCSNLEVRPSPENLALLASGMTFASITSWAPFEDTQKTQRTASRLTHVLFGTCLILSAAKESSKSKSLNALFSWFQTTSRMIAKCKWGTQPIAIHAQIQGVLQDLPSLMQDFSYHSMHPHFLVSAWSSSPWASTTRA